MVFGMTFKLNPVLRNIFTAFLFLSVFSECSDPVPPEIAFKEGLIYRYTGSYHPWSFLCKCHKICTGI